jgi:hypothetical protein
MLAARLSRLKSGIGRKANGPTGALALVSVAPDAGVVIDGRQLAFFILRSTIISQGTDTPIANM